MSTYANLVQDIKDWTENNGTDFADEIDRFIDNTELRLSKELIDCPALRRHATSSLTVNDPFINKPSGLNTTISLQIVQLLAHLNILVIGTKLFLLLHPHPALL